MRDTARETSVLPAAGGLHTGPSAWSHADPRRFINRELSLLEFDARVLALAEEADRLLLERVRFMAIFSRNLDEVFQVRVGGLRTQRQLRAQAVSPDGLNPDEQLIAIRQRVTELVARQCAVFADMRPALEAAGIRLVTWEEIDSKARGHLDRVFEEQLFPVLTPLAVDPAHPFPYISTLSLNLVVVVQSARGKERRVARVKVPPLLPRFLTLPDHERFIAIEHLIAAHMPRLFAGTNVIACHPFRVTRNADFQLEEEAEDLLEAVQGVLHRRRRSPEAVRLEVDGSATPEVIRVLTRELDLTENDVYVYDGPLDLGGLFEIYALDRPDLKDAAWHPVTPPRLRPAPGEESLDVFNVLRAGPVLVHHPYESFEESVEAFIEQAAADADVLAIKQTLYRTSGPISPIVRALVHAAESGKQVVALIELTARFDEQANIGWAQMLERAGVHVVYGIVGMKTHCKVTLVVRQELGAIRRYCHVGTGNYNSDTARMYEDIGLLSADPQLGEDLSDLFNTLTGYSRQQRYRRLLVAPIGLRSALIRLIEAEARKPDGHITLKVNSLTDPELIDVLYAASQAGAQIQLIVRGMCSLRPGVPGLSETISVRSIVGRYLEHSRIFRFGSDPHSAHYLIGSADLMHRNLDQRVEVVAPVLPEQLRARLAEILETCLADDSSAWRLNSDGAWEKVAPERGVSAQLRLQELALSRAVHV